EDFKLLLKRQQLERDLLIQRHRDEIELFRRQQLLHQTKIGSKYEVQQQVQPQPPLPPPPLQQQAPQMVPTGAHPYVLSMSPNYPGVGPAVTASNLEEYLMFSTAPQSPTYESSGPSLPNTPPPYIQHQSSQGLSLSAEDMMRKMNRPVVISAATGQQYITNSLPIMSPNQGVVGFGTAALFHQAAGHVATGAALNGCMGTEGLHTSTAQQVPRNVRYNEPLWVPLSTANPIPNSAQCFNQYPIGTIGGLPGFRRVSTASGSLLQLAPGLPQQLAPSVNTPGYYFQPAVTPLLQAGMRFAYETQQRQDGTASPTPQSSGPASPSDRRHYNRGGPPPDHN
ncbi:hypothetical protein L9F63_021058, partial [Diploptera punctata]